MKNQLLIVGLIAVVGASTLNADRFYQTFEKPYRQEAALAASSVMLLGGGYKFARSIAGRRPVGALLSMGAMSAGSLGVLIAEGNSKQPKLITNERFPSLIQRGLEQYKYTPKSPCPPHAAFDGFLNVAIDTPSIAFNRGLNHTMSAFNHGMDKTESLFVSARTKALSAYNTLKTKWDNFKTRN